jgi:hypothetical protein
MGAITHPTGIIGKRDLNNFQPRLGLAWNFQQKWVFRSSFGIMTVDSSGTGGFDEYAGSYNILQPTGDPRYLFRLQDGPGKIQYTVNADGTVPYTGASYGSRTATWRDPNLHSPYVMNWSAGFQYQIAGTWVVNLTYQGTAGVGTRAQLEHQPNPSVYRVRRKPSTTRYGLSIAAELPLVPTIRGHQLFVEFQPQYLAQWERHCGEALRQRAHPECQLQPLEIIEQFRPAWLL